MAPIFFAKNKDGQLYLYANCHAFKFKTQWLNKFI